MNKVEKIVTARNTAFLLGFPKDSAQESPKITDIEVVFADDSICSYIVTFSDKTEIEVKDAVEVWRVPMTEKENADLVERWAQFP